MALSFNYCCVVFYRVSCHFCARHTSRNAASRTCLSASITKACHSASPATHIRAVVATRRLTTFLLGLFLRD